MTRRADRLWVVELLKDGVWTFFAVVGTDAETTEAEANAEIVDPDHEWRVRPYVPEESGR